MIHPIIEHKIVNSIEDLMIPADNVAHVFANNTLSHGMLVLSTVNYSMIPVLSSDSKLIGLINMPLMIKAITTIEAIEVEKLDQILIEEVMIEPPVFITVDTSFERILSLLVDHNFLSVLGEEGIFLGIVTRRNLLTHVNRFVHSISDNEDLKQLILEIARYENK